MIIVIKIFLHPVSLLKIYLNITGKKSKRLTFWMEVLIRPIELIYPNFVEAKKQKQNKKKPPENNSPGV